jgi:hypothetical protein
MTENGENLATGYHSFFQVPLRHSSEETRENMKTLVPSMPPRWVMMSVDNKASVLTETKITDTLIVQTSTTENVPYFVSYRLQIPLN